MPASIGQFIHDSAPFACSKQHQLGRILNRQGSQHKRIHQAENRRIRANAERERKDGYGGEAGRLAERAAGEVQISPARL